MNDTKLNCKFYVIKFYNFVIFVYLKKIWCYFKQKQFQLNRLANLLLPSVNNLQGIV